MNQNGQTDDNSRNAFVRVWRGQLSLPITYWGFGVVGNLIFSAAGQAINPSSTIERLLIIACMIAYSIFAYVGIWRAADRYTGRKAWALLAKLAVLFSIANTIRSLGSAF
jgi:hypothetical protein